jgi:hypothetical protein
MDKNLERTIENVRALAGSALGTLQALDDELRAFVSILGADRDGGKPSEARRKAKENSNGRHEQIRKRELHQG